MANLYRIFPIVYFRRLCFSFLAFVTALAVSTTLVSIFQCVPIHDFWDAFAGAVSSKGRCINVQNYFLIVGSINAVTYFVLLALVRECEAFVF